jgi:hypothetical protein
MVLLLAERMNDSLMSATRFNASTKLRHVPSLPPQLIPTATIATIPCISSVLQHDMVTEARVDGVLIAVNVAVTAGAGLNSSVETQVSSSNNTIDVEETSGQVVVDIPTIATSSAQSIPSHVTTASSTRRSYLSIAPEVLLGSRLYQWLINPPTEAYLNYVILRPSRGEFAWNIGQRTYLTALQVYADLLTRCTELWQTEHSSSQMFTSMHIDMLTAVMDHVVAHNGEFPANIAHVRLRGVCAMGMKEHMSVHGRMLTANDVDILEESCTVCMERFTVHTQAYTHPKVKRMRTMRSSSVVPISSSMGNGRINMEIDSSSDYDLANAKTRAILDETNEHNSDRVVTLPTCKHHFHEACIRPWLECNNICPCCRSVVYFTALSNEEDGSTITCARKRRNTCAEVQ